MLLPTQGGVFDKQSVDILNQVLAGGLGPGQVFFVDAAKGNDRNTGAFPDWASPGPGLGPFQTVNEAVAHCVAGRGDSLSLAVGSYAENIVLSIDGVSLFGGLPGRYEWPDIVPAAGVPLTVTGQGVTVQRVRCAGTAADCLVQRGNGFMIQSCILDIPNTAAKCGVRLLPSDTDDSYTASEGFVLDSVFRYAGNSPVGLIFDTGAAPAVGVGSTDNVIARNRFYGGTGVDIATADTGGGTYSVQRVLITQNSFEDKNKATYLDFTTANGGAAGDQSGAASDNDFATDTMTTTKIKAVGTAFTFVRNADTVGIFDGSGLD